MVIKSRKFLLKVFIKSELKVGVIYVKEGQYTEEEILDNNDNSVLFEEFLQIFGEKVRLKGFDKYKGGLDTVHDLTGALVVLALLRLKPDDFRIIFGLHELEEH